jgi:hypothetical protein
LIREKYFSPASFGRFCPADHEGIIEMCYGHDAFGSMKSMPTEKDPVSPRRYFAGRPECFDGGKNMFPTGIFCVASPLFRGNFPP